MNPRDLIGEALRSRRTEESENYPVTLPASPAPHPQSGANGPAPPWVPDRKYVKLKVSQTHSKFYCFYGYAPGGISQQPLAFSVCRAGSRALFWGQPFGVLVQQGGESFGPHHTVMAAEVRNGGGVWGRDSPFSDRLQGAMRCYWPPYGGGCLDLGSVQG